MKNAGRPYKKLRVITQASKLSLKSTVGLPCEFLQPSMGVGATDAGASRATSRSIYWPKCLWDNVLLVIACVRMCDLCVLLAS
eukprot:4407638-Amphidinium_carterae.2